MQATGNSFNSAGNMIAALKAAAASNQPEVTAFAKGNAGTGSRSAATGSTGNLGGRRRAESGPMSQAAQSGAPAGRHLTQATGNSVDSAGNMIGALRAAAASAQVTASAGPGGVGTGNSASRVATGGTRNLGGRRLAES